MKVTVESMGQFCAARAADLNLIVEVFSVAGGVTSNAGVALRMGAMEATEGLIRDLQQASRDAVNAGGFDDGETFPPTEVQMPPAKPVYVKQGAKRGRKPKAAAVAPDVLPGQESIIVAGVPLPSVPRGWAPVPPLEEAEPLQREGSTDPDRERFGAE